MNNKQIFDGLRILDLGHVIAAPYCTMFFADMGADVIKVEPPVTGEEARMFKPFINGVSTYFVNYNRGKRGITINLKSPRGRLLLLELVKTADIIVENFRPGFMKKYGMDYENLRAVKPDLIYVAISGFGQNGLYRSYACYDPIAQAMSGLSSVTGWADQEPSGCGGSVVDIMCGQMAIVAALAALWYRRVTGEGQMVDLSLCDTAVSAMAPLIQYYLSEGIIVGPQGNQTMDMAPGGTAEARDGKVMYVVDTEKKWKRLCEVMGRNDLSNHPKFTDNNSRLRNRKRLEIIVNHWSQKKTCIELTDQFHLLGIPAGPVRGIDEALKDPFILEKREMITEVDGGEAGPVRVTNIPIKMSYAGPRAGRLTPRIGEHNDEIYFGELLLSKDELDALRREGII